MRRIGVVSILILISVACSNDYVLEDQFCDCYREYAGTIDADFDALVLKIEQHYLDEGTLESTNGASYYKNVELLAELSKDYDLAHSLIDFEEIQSEMVQLSQIRENADCNYLYADANEGSRISRLNNCALIDMGNGILFESIWENHAKELTAKDYNHNFFKADYFIADYVMFQVEFSDIQSLPLKVDFPDLEPLLSDLERSAFGVVADETDVLQVNGESMEITGLYSAILNFYQANIDGEDNDPDVPMYIKVDSVLCQTKITALEKEASLYSLDQLEKNELSNWKIKLELTNYFEDGVYMEMDEYARIQLQASRGTSYGLYIEIQNIIKQVVNELRVAKCEELGWPNYFDLKWDEEKDQDYIKMLRILVPERIVESRIEH